MKKVWTFEIPEFSFVDILLLFPSLEKGKLCDLELDSREMYPRQDQVDQLIKRSSRKYKNKFPL